MACCYCFPLACLFLSWSFGLWGRLYLTFYLYSLDSSCPFSRGHLRPSSTPSLSLSLYLFLVDVDDVKRGRSATAVVEEESQSVGSTSRTSAVTFAQFARRFFQNKAVDSHKYQRTALKGPLLKQIWGDGDADVRCEGAWFAGMGRR